MHSSATSGMLFRSIALALIAVAACWALAPENWAGLGGAPYVQALLIAAFLLCAYCLGHRRAVCRPEHTKAEALSQRCMAVQRESQFRSLMDCCPDSVARYDRVCRITYVNRRLEKVLDIPAERILGQVPAEIFPDPKCGKQIEGLIARVLTTGEGDEMELAFPDRGSGVRYEQFFFVAERDAAGNIVGVLSIGRDITKYKRSEESLRHQRDFLEKLVDTVAAPVFVKDRQDRWRYLNEAFCELIGSSREELMGNSESECLAANAARMLRQGDEAVFKRREEFEAEGGLSDKAGNNRYLRIRKRLLADGGGDQLLVGVISDLTKRRQMEQSLESSRQRHEDAQRIAHLGNWELDLATRHLHWSDEMFRIFELDPELSAPSHGTLIALVHPDDRARVKQAYADAVHQLAPFDMEHRLLMPDGKIKYVHQRGAAIYAKDGTPLRSIGTVQDVSAAREAARQLEESSLRLQELAAHREEVREEERRRIARELHEDLGQLLTSLRMGLSLLRIEFGAQNTALVEKIPPLLALVDQSIEGLRHTVADLRPTPLDMGIVPALEWLVRVFGNHSGIECRLRCTNGIDLPDDKATAIFRVVQEALTNVARHADADHAEVVLEIADGALELRIKDDGRGFDPLASRRNSFGLGGIWERSLMLRGELDIQSAVGQGTEIILRCSL